MGNFTASTDWVVAIQSQIIDNKKRRNNIKLTLVTTANDGYPAGGIPLPAYNALGFVRGVDYINVYDPANTASGWVWKFGVSAQVLRAYRVGAVSAPMVEAGTATVFAGQVFYVEAVGW